MSEHPPTDWTSAPESVTLADLMSKIEDLLHVVAEMTTRVHHLEVTVESCSASAQRSENAANAAFNAVATLEPRLTAIAVETEVLARAAVDASYRASRSEAQAVASYAAVQAMATPMREKLPTGRPGSEPPK